MIGKLETEFFLNKNVGLLYQDSNCQKYLRCFIVQVFDNSVMVQLPDGRSVLISLAEIISIKELVA